MQRINSDKIKEMLAYSVEILCEKKEEINTLNVFPVPDGDTGSNMSMTLQAGYEEIKTQTYTRADEIFKDFSKGLLMGARGNSGVILSQFFRGFAEAVDGKEELTTSDFQSALQNASERAYGSVIKAVEGTILTVTKDMSKKMKLIPKNFPEYMIELVLVANESLENTPNLLPILKEVGVVDSGGYGLVTIIEAMNAVVLGKKIEIKNDLSFENFRKTEEHPMDPEDITFGFCTEMLINVYEPEKFDINQLRAKLETMGDSIVAIQDDEIVKVHVHTEEPTKVFEYGNTFGDFIHIKSENMRIQAENEQKKQALNKSEKRLEQAIVAVASSEKMGELFNQITEVTTVSGGQTLNPSTEELVAAVRKTNADNVIILPNNSNIIMAAQAVKELLPEINIEVIPTKFMTQAIEGLSHFDQEVSFEENIQLIKESLKNMFNVEITQAIRDTSIEGVDINENDFMALVDGKIKYSSKKISLIFESLVKDFKAFDADLIVVLKGLEGEDSVLKDFEEKIDDTLDFADVTIYETEQPVYSYLITGIK